MGFLEDVKRWACFGGGSIPPTDENGDPLPELDLCFLCDCTASMGDYIAAAQSDIKSIVKDITTWKKADVRFALISYRDHPPEDTSYVTKTFPFTNSMTTMYRYVGSMSAEGGGDGPEAVTAALAETLTLPWRPNAAKVAVLIADAPPHGIEPDGDGFPDGDPQGRDPLDIARQMAAKGITCYSVGAEPALGNYEFARDFLCTLAEITGGQAVALSSSSLLSQVISGGSAEEISLVMLEREVEEEVHYVRRQAEQLQEEVSVDELEHRAYVNLKAKGMQSTQMSTDGFMKNASPNIWHKSAGCAPQTLAGAKAELMSCRPLTPPELYPRTGPDSYLGLFNAASECSLELAPADSNLESPWAGSARLGSLRSAAPRSAAAAEPCPSKTASSTHVTLTENDITYDQVHRIMKKKAYW